jgi:hypothetical protein
MSKKMKRELSKQDDALKQIEGYKESFPTCNMESLENHFIQQRVSTADTIGRKPNGGRGNKT